MYSITIYFSTGKSVTYPSVKKSAINVIVNTNLSIDDVDGVDIQKTKPTEKAGPLFDKA